MRRRPLGRDPVFWLVAVFAAFLLAQRAAALFDGLSKLLGSK